MSYIRAEECLPKELVKEIQKYVQGSQIYIPGKEEERRSWGERNGTRKMLDKRNHEIRRLKSLGTTIDTLADEFNLSTDSIRKIVYCTRKEAV